MGMQRSERNLTRQRRAVLEAVRQSEEHLTAREILDRARTRQPRLSHATVYNALAYLVREGLVQELSLGEGASRYDRRDSAHGHAVCDACGRVADLDLPELAEALKEAAAGAGFDPTALAITVHGRCASCRQPDEGPVPAPGGECGAAR